MRGLEFGDGRFEPFDHVVSTMPLTLVVDGLGDPPPRVRAAADQLRFRNTILVYLHVGGRDLFAARPAPAAVRAGLSVAPAPRKNAPRRCCGSDRERGRGVRYRRDRVVGGIDLRNRVVGARVLAAGMDPYTFRWQPGTPERLLDPVHRAELPRVTVPPTALCLYGTISWVPYRPLRLVHLGLEWAALLASVAVLVRTVPNRRTRVVFLLVAAVFFADVIVFVDAPSSSLAGRYGANQQTAGLPVVDLGRVSKLILAGLVGVLTWVGWRSRGRPPRATLTMFAVLLLGMEYLLPERWPYVDVHWLLPLALAGPALLSARPANRLPLLLVLTGLVAGNVLALASHPILTTLLRAYLVPAGLVWVAWAEWNRRRGRAAGGPSPHAPAT